MMSDAVGKLDGLREIIHPIEPPQADYSTALLLVILMGVLLLLTYLYIQYRRRPLVKARRLFKHLKKHKNDWDAIRCGDCLINIMQYCEKANWPTRDSEVSQSVNAWKSLQSQCDQLRFSGVKNQSEKVGQAISQMQNLLRPAS